MDGVFVGQAYLVEEQVVVDLTPFFEAIT